MVGELVECHTNCGAQASSDSPSQASVLGNRRWEVPTPLLLILRLLFAYFCVVATLQTSSIRFCFAHPSSEMILTDFRDGATDKQRGRFIRGSSDCDENSSGI